MVLIIGANIQLLHLIIYLISYHTNKRANQSKGGDLDDCFQSRKSKQKIQKNVQTVRIYFVAACGPVQVSWLLPPASSQISLFPSGTDLHSVSSGSLPLRLRYTTRRKPVRYRIPLCLLVLVSYPIGQQKERR